MCYHDESLLKFMNQGSFCLMANPVMLFTAVCLAELILQKFENLKIANFWNPKQVYFLVTRINYVGKLLTKRLCCSHTNIF